MICRITLFFIFVFSSLSLAENTEFLPVEQAFPYQWEMVADGAQVHFSVQPGYYLYKSRFKVSAEDGVALKPVEFSIPGDLKNDKYFGEVVVFSQPVTIKIPYHGAGQLKVKYQGCAQQGLCYLPQTIRLDLPSLPALDEAASVPQSSSWWEKVEGLAQDTAGLSVLLGSVSRPQALMIFFLLGLGLSLTPCVLPMVPILSSIIGGQAHISGRKGFALSVSYVLGMASSYALTGIVVTTLAKGINIQSAMQQPWLLSCFAVVFVLLALAMFGFYELQLPAALQQRLNSQSGKLGGGKLMSVYLMGAVSALVVSPCVSAPLAGALLYVSTTQDWMFGGVTLFVMALGMGIPLIVIGVSGGKLLPKSGSWMVVVKQLFGVLLLAVAVMLLSRFVAGWVSMLLWALLAIGSGIHFGGLDSAKPGWERTRKLVAFMSLFYGLVLFIGMLTGSEDPLQPLNVRTESRDNRPATLPFATVRSVSVLNQQLAEARVHNKRVMIDLYADWCVSCKVIEKEVFGDPSVQSQFSDWNMIKFDVTEGTPEQLAWLSERDVFGPPALFFFDSQGRELDKKRILGAIGLEQFQSMTVHM
ncbi:protein-disulfide reductase DsbD [Vibrio ostreicida]|uniref:Protein-disulfide reductase DsbD n=1 Tax=Vibrio ostreicida TaxID=526588 RepID=A0ABT8C1S0_9VIBR|nr:protein-disulfide reductase DsbD [Vibrio ostreicida]MDN3612293.1 protein-disulfide reductase DsbD [Vibrio ostreicida]NPD08676.1 protein-disulfide reductase DsbD [Vibrio ostreicida]